MRVAVVGAGIAGTLTSHYLFEHGCNVTVFDRASAPASNSSRANGGQLSYSFCDAMADPQILRKLPSIMLRQDPAFQIRPSLRREFLGWGMSFLQQCTTERRDKNTNALLSLSKRSAELMQELSRNFGDENAIERAGKLVLLNTTPDAELQRRVSLKNRQGFDVQILNTDETLELEPSIEQFRDLPAAAIYSPGDEVGNAHTFIGCMARSLQAKGVVFCFDQEILSIHKISSGQQRVRTSESESDFDAIVIATGNDLSLLSKLGLRLPILPMSGYSWSFPAKDSSPSVSITALAQRLVFSRFDDIVRVAGFADVNLKESEIARRADLLKKLASSIAPHAANYDAAVEAPWHGIRAMTPNSTPIVGATKLPSIYVNLGHGMLGWTLGAATSELVAKAVIQA